MYRSPVWFPQQRAARVVRVASLFAVTSKRIAAIHGRLALVPNLRLDREHRHPLRRPRAQVPHLARFTRGTL